MSYQSVNPFDGKIVKTFEQLTDAQLKAALETPEKGRRQSRSSE